MKTLIAAPLVLCLASPALAQEPEANAEAEGEAVLEAEPSPTIENQTPQPELLNRIELLPATAFPSPKTRGIPNGSLSGTFHGLQWPYMPYSGIGFSGSAWVDSGYETIDRGNETEQDINYWLQQGRVLLRVTPTYSDGDFFVQGQAEIVANKDQSLRQPDVADTDDLWLRIGKWKKWDIQIGRFEGWEVYHLGMGLDLNTLEREGATSTTYAAPELYLLSYAFYRPDGVGQAAAHLYPTDWLRLELGTQFGNEFGQNALAARPVAVLDFGALKIKAGGEYKKVADQAVDLQGESTKRGVGGGITYTFGDMFELGASGAVGLVDVYKQDGAYDSDGSNTTYSTGVFGNVQLIEDVVLGGGFNYTYLENLREEMGRVEKFNHVQTFGALQYLVAKRLFVKAVFAYAEADFAPNDGGPIFENHMYSGRVRVLYVF